MAAQNYSIVELQNLWCKLWLEMFEIEVEPEEPPYETATVLQEFVRRVNNTDPVE